MTVPRVFLIVLDGLGVGASPDAASFGDVGAHTLDHLVEAAGGLNCPRLEALGLGHIAGVKNVRRVAKPEGAYGRLAEVSAGKDTPTGHWEMMGCKLDWAFPLFPDGFPEDVLQAWSQRCNLPGWLANHAASGMQVIEQYGPEHLQSGKPIVYTSGDSVFQVAAHAESFGVERLLSICREARTLLDPLKVGRVIARPFVGEPGSFTRTYDRRDFGIEPPSETVLDRLAARGVPVWGVGKINDLFCGRGVTHDVHSEGNADGMRLTLELAESVESGLIFVNLVDFDSLYGHRRDPKGFRDALERFDPELAKLEALLRPGDLILLTADHGNDPTFTQTTDHTREYVPFLAAGPGLDKPGDLGTMPSFATVGEWVEGALR
ncbi:MAG: phosphopentomutase [Planctomycetota bacterium]